MKALAVVGGSSLEVLVCGGHHAACSVLDEVRREGRPRRVRVWPLDSITVRDISHQQQAAMSKLEPGKAWRPLDFLLPSKSEYAPALQRAFGGMLIVSDLKTATTVSSVDGLNCVTVDGVVSRPGQVRTYARMHEQQP